MVVLLCWNSFSFPITKYVTVVKYYPLLYIDELLPGTNGELIILNLDYVARLEGVLGKGEIVVEEEGWKLVS